MGSRPSRRGERSGCPAVRCTARNPFLGKAAGVGENRCGFDGGCGLPWAVRSRVGPLCGPERGAFSFLGV